MESMSGVDISMVVETTLGEEDFIILALVMFADSDDIRELVTMVMDVNGVDEDSTAVGDGVNVSDESEGAILEEKFDPGDE